MTSMTTWVSLELIMISKRSRHIKTSTEKSHSCRKHSEGDLEDSMSLQSERPSSRKDI